MRRVILMLAVAALLLGGVGRAEATPIGYNLAVTTTYQFDAPPGVVGPYVGSPDTGFFQITNNGSSTFTGTIGEVAVSQFSGDFSYSIGGITLAPGQSSGWFGTSPESSNVGGFNGSFGSPQPGIEIDIVGSILLGVQSEGVNLSVHDADIHSGVPRTNPYGITLDNYVLQGGDPLGNDTGDAYETTQANGIYTFSESPSVATPEPASLTLLGGLGLGLVGYGWRRRKA